MLTSKDFKVGDILVTLGGYQHKDEKGPILDKDLIVMVNFHFEDNTLGFIQDSNNKVTCSKLFRHASEHEKILYKQGYAKIPSIINNYSIY